MTKYILNNAITAVVIGTATNWSNAENCVLPPKVIVAPSVKPFIQEYVGT